MIRRRARRTTAGHGRASRRGFTVVELALVLAIVGLLGGLAVSTYLRYVEKARVTRAVAELSSIARILDGLSTDDETPLPDALAELDLEVSRDPWGHNYRYLRIAGNLPPGAAGLPPALPPVAAPAGGGAPAIGQARKDGFLVPINSDYDLYSVGRDGRSKPTLNAPESRDDVIRAGDGSYFGLAEEY